MNREIGGYIELDESSGEEYHSKAIRLNTGRNCLRYIIRSRNVKKIALPIYDCDAVEKTAREEKIEISYYHVDRQLNPIISSLSDDEYLYYVNYYGLKSDQIRLIYSQHEKMIVDNAQAFFDRPVCGCDTLYTCRKFFGVCDGAYLYIDKKLDDPIPESKSYDRIGYILGRYENRADEFYSDYVKNEKAVAELPISNMSKLTKNMLKSIDYEMIKNVRTSNYDHIRTLLDKYNELEIKSVAGAYMYPLLIKNGCELRRKLIERKIYIPLLWPNVIETCSRDDIEYHVADNLVPIPCDQRYSLSDMEYIADNIADILQKE